jgi:hypothetical protein
MSEPIALEDRMEAAHKFFLQRRPTFSLPGFAHAGREYDLHLATLVDAIEALMFEKVVGK